MAGRKISATLSLREWEILRHALATAAGTYTQDKSPAHEGVADEIREVAGVLRVAWANGTDVATDRP